MQKKTKSALRVCKHCGRAFAPKSKTNKYCSNSTCRAERRARYMESYMRKWREKHPNYWKTPAQREYLRKWREAHPNYFKNWRKKQMRRAAAAQRRGK